MYRIRILDAATRELAQLGKPPISRRIAERRLAANLDAIRPEALKRELTGLYKLRVGGYRVIYEILHDEQAIVIQLPSRSVQSGIKLVARIIWPSSRV